MKLRFKLNNTLIESTYDSYINISFDFHRAYDVHIVRLTSSGRPELIVDGWTDLILDIFFFSSQLNMRKSTENVTSGRPRLVNLTILD